MPFYDDFDLSTVDVLLISQYVYTLAFGSSIKAGDQAYHCSRTCMEDFWNQRLVYQKQWNIICTIQFDSGDVPPHPALMYIATSSIVLRVYIAQFDPS